MIDDLAVKMSRTNKSRLNMIKQEFNLKRRDDALTLVLNLFEKYKNDNSFNFITDFSKKTEEFLEEVRKIDPHFVPPVIYKIKETMKNYEK